MNLLGAVVVVLLFTVLVYVVGLIPKTLEVITISRDSVSVMRNRDLDDETKEKAMQRHSIRLFALLGLLVAGSSISMFAPVGIIWLLDAAGLLSFNGVVDMLMSWDFLITVTVLGLSFYIILRRRNL